MNVNKLPFYNTQGAAQASSMNTTNRARIEFTGAPTNRGDTCALQARYTRAAPQAPSSAIRGQSICQHACQCRCRVHQACPKACTAKQKVSWCDCTRHARKRAQVLCCKPCGAGSVCRSSSAGTGGSSQGAVQQAPTAGARQLAHKGQALSRRSWALTEYRSAGAGSSRTGACARRPASR